MALISGAIADRAKFSTWMVFTVVWATVVYFPVAHWVFAFDGFAADKGGWIANQLKAIDFAGGTAVHINAGAAGLALALVLGKRVGFGKEPMRPHNLTLVMIGAGLLWFGWFGFNAGSALGANGTAAIAWVNTLAATGAAMLGWLVVEKIRDGHATSLGAASGVVAGLVAITPACCARQPARLGRPRHPRRRALRPGRRPEVPLRLRRQPRRRRRPPRRRPLGHLAIGFLACSAPAGVDGLFYGGGVDQLCVRPSVPSRSWRSPSSPPRHRPGPDKTLGFRIDQDAEVAGIDQQEHAETVVRPRSVGGGRIGSGAVGTSARPPAGTHSASSSTRPRGSIGMKLVTAIIKPHQLDEVKEALEAFGISGMTVSEATATAASAATARSTAVPSTPSTSCRRSASRCSSTTSTASSVVDVILKAAQTGRIGDGKIWVVPVEDVARVRTGERGVEAL